MSGYIAHFGIKGQKWGVRRFQEEDGTLTSAGKSRYRSGKEYDRERHDIEKKEIERQKNASKEYQRSAAETKRLQERYGLNEEGRGGDSTRFTQEELRRARDRHWQENENRIALESKFKERANQRSFDKIKKKYGQTAIDDINHYHKKNERATKAFLGAAAAATIAAFIVGQTNKAKYRGTAAAFDRTFTRAGSSKFF